MCKEFNELMKKIKITVHRISTLSLLVKYKIIIHLFEKFFIKSEKQWLKNKNHLFSEFLQRVKKNIISINWIYIWNDMSTQKAMSMLN